MRLWAGRMKLERLDRFLWLDKAGFSTLLSEGLLGSVGQPMFLFSPETDTTLRAATHFPQSIEISRKTGLCPELNPHSDQHQYPVCVLLPAFSRSAHADRPHGTGEAHDRDFRTV